MLDIMSLELSTFDALIVVLLKEINNLQKFQGVESLFWKFEILERFIN